jgi:CRP/FNR family transcriptional regulator, cyclic AMP receptor protein
MTTRAELEAVTALRAIDFFSDMHTSHLKKLSTITDHVEFAKGDIIYQEGDENKMLYLIQEGEVVVEMKAPNHTYATVLTIESGQLLGWTSVFPGQRKRARARVIKPVRAMTIDGERLNHLFLSDHKLEHVMMQRLIKLVGERIYTTRRILLECCNDLS